MRERARVVARRFTRELGRRPHRLGNVRFAAVRRDVRVEVRIGIREQHVLHEGDRRRGSLDVGDDRANGAHS
jgi:hypothetical protein